MQLSSIKHAVMSAPGSTLSGAKNVAGWGARGVSSGLSGIGNIASYAFTFFKDLTKSGLSFCNNHARQIGIGTAGIAVVALIVYCAKRFFRPAPAAPSAPPAGPAPAASANTKAISAAARDARAVTRNAAKARAAATS